MLPSKNRLVQKRDFQRVYKKGKKIYSYFFVIRYLANATQLVRIGIVISCKVSNKSTVRNRLKRQTREIFRKFIEKIKPGFDIIIVFHRQIDDYPALKKELEKCLKTASLL